MKQMLGDEEAALLAEADSLNRLYKEIEEFESQMLQWQDEGETEQYDANYDKYEAMLQEYNERYNAYEAKRVIHNGKVGKYNSLIGVR